MMITLSDAEKRALLRRVVERSLRLRREGELDDASLLAVTFGTAVVLDAHDLRPIVMPPQTESGVQ